MKEKLKKYIETKKNKILNLSEIYSVLHLPYTPENDEKIYNLINDLEQEDYIIHLKTSKRTYQGCYEKYKVLNLNKKDKEKVKKEILNLNKKIKIDYYLKHVEEYEKNKDFILKINKFLQEQKETQLLTVNERSYKIYKNEKLLKENESILNKLGINYQDLYAIDMYEPFFYYINTDYNKMNTNKNILIVENKDTFWTVVKTIQNLKLTNLYMVIYGEGKKIIKSFSFTKELGIGIEDNIWYFGDIDYEGINIYETLKEKYNHYKIEIYKLGYETILEIEDEPGSLRNAQNINSEKINKFLEEFPKKYKKILSEIFMQNKFIPQEVFNLEVAKQKMQEGGSSSF